MTTAEYPEEYKVNKLIGHRKVGRVAEFLVRWCDIKGEKFDDSWEAAIREYKARLSGIESKVVQVDVRPHFQSARRTVAPSMVRELLDEHE